MKNSTFVNFLLAVLLVGVVGLSGCANPEKSVREERQRTSIPTKMIKMPKALWGNHVVVAYRVSDPREKEALASGFYVLDQEVPGSNGWEYARRYQYLEAKEISVPKSAQVYFFYHYDVNGRTGYDGVKLKPGRGSVSNSWGPPSDPHFTLAHLPGWVEDFYWMGYFR